MVLLPVLAAAAPHVARGELTARLAVAMGLTFLLGLEREIRGSSAGDRTFSLVGIGAAVIAYLATHDAPNALAGVVTGIGFLGAGVIIHGGGDREGAGMVRGITTAAAFFVAAAVGAAAGQGQLLLATEATVAAVFVLEIHHIRVLRVLDGHYWSARFRNDAGMDGNGTGPDDQDRAVGGPDGNGAGQP